MHGIIHAELKSFVEIHHSADAWKAVLAEAGLTGKLYMAISAYPDEEAIAVVKAAARLTKTPASRILEDFGIHIAPKLLTMYRSLIKPEWKTKDLLLNTEDTIHRVVRQKNPGAEPPRLQFTDTGPNTLKLFYNSPRRMSAVAQGIIKGVAAHYNESVKIVEQKNADGSSEMAITVS